MENLATKEILVRAAAFRGAHECKAKDDVRYYLNGVMLDTDGMVVATDGSVMFKARGGFNTDSPIIINVAYKIPAKTTECRFRILNKEEGILDCLQGVEVIKKLHFSIINGKYPDYNKIGKDVEEKDVSEIGLNPKFVKLVSDVMGDGSIMKFHGDGNLVTITPMDPELKSCGAEMILMPMRL